MPKIFIAMPCGGTVHAGQLLFFQEVRKIEKYADYETDINIVSSSRTPENRNRLVQKFLKTDHEWFLHIDADTIPPLNLYDMIDNDKGVCSGVYYIWMDKKMSPLLMLRKGKTNHYYQFDKEVPDNQYLIEVDAVGGGNLLIKREVLERIKPPWFKDVYSDKDEIKRTLGNDFYFCQKAQTAGYKIYGDLRIYSNHMREVNLSEIHDWVRDNFIMKQWK